MMTTLQKIRKKVRRLTATPSPLQLPDSEIDEYVDTFYEIDMPAELKLWNLHDTYTFYTSPNEDEYTLPVNTILGINPPVYISGYQAYYTQLQEDLYRMYPITETNETVTSGNGTAGPYTFTLTNLVVRRRSFYVSTTDTNDITRILEDIPVTESTGNLVAVGTAVPVGTINYVTGAVTVTNFGDVIASGEDIVAKYDPYTASRPTAMLFYDDTITLRPIPDDAYKVTVQAYRKPSQLLDASTDSPDLEQWWQFIAFGAALKVLEDRQDTETIQLIYPRYDEQKQMVLHRTILQQTPQRTSTIYTEQQFNGSNQSFGGGY